MKLLKTFPKLGRNSCQYNQEFQLFSRHERHEQDSSDSSDVPGKATRSGLSTKTTWPGSQACIALF